MKRNKMEDGNSCNNPSRFDLRLRQCVTGLERAKVAIIFEKVCTRCLPAVLHRVACTVTNTACVNSAPSMGDMV